MAPFVTLAALSTRPMPATMRLVAVAQAATPTATPLPTPTAAPSPSPAPLAAPTPSPASVAPPTSAPTPIATSAPTATPTPTPKPTPKSLLRFFQIGPKATPTPVPTPVPTTPPTPPPTPTPTATPLPSPSPSASVAPAPTPATAATPALHATDLRDRSAFLVGDIWVCESVAGVAETHLYKRGPDGTTINMANTLTVKGKPYRLDETYKFNAARNEWTATLAQGTFVVTAPPWTATKWIFTGTQVDNGGAQPVRMIYTYFDDFVFRRDFQVRRSNAWATSAAETCTRNYPSDQ